MQKCPNCDEQVTRGLTTHSVTLEGVTVSADLPSWTCQKCKESFFAGPTLARFDLFAAETFGLNGLATGEVFRYMRKALGLPATELAKMYGTTPETISRWENGKHPISRLETAFLTALVMTALGHGIDARELLTHYANPTRPVEPIHLKIAS